MTDDFHLAARAAKGDATAFRLLLERHYDLIFRVAFRFLGNRPDAEDLAQEICVSLVGKLASFRGTSALTTWLYRVTVNAARDFVRRRASSAARDAAFSTSATLEREAAADQAAQAAWMYDALATLSDDLREATLLVVAEGLSHAEAGQVLGIKEATVSWRLHEARKKLSSLVSSDYER
ncbi:MAG: RNA polymerase sigma factor [Alphaproteobacteria bacterium]